MRPSPREGVDRVRSPLLDSGGALRGAASPWMGPSPPVQESSGSVFFRPDVDGRRRQRKETAVPVVRPLPDHPSLANLRKQAKSLLAAWQAGGQQALTRGRELHPR